jgi:hypothetical protein
MPATTKSSSVAGPGVSAPVAGDFREAQGLAFDGYFYVIGGFVAGFRVMTDQMNRYDPVNNSWMPLAPMNLGAGAGITHAGQAVHSATRTIYLCGGFLIQPGQTWGDMRGGGDSTARVWAYSIDRNTWSEPFLLPEDRGGGGCAVVDDRYLHFAGGAHHVNLKTTDHVTHWRKDLANASSVWEEMAPLLHKRNHMALVTLGGLMYALGGQLDHDEVSGNQQWVERYDPQADRWTMVASLPMPLGHITPSVVAHQGHLLVLGGTTTGKVWPKQLLLFNPTSGPAGQWSVLSASSSIIAGPSQVVGVIGNRLFAQCFKTFQHAPLDIAVPSGALATQCSQVPFCAACAPSSLFCILCRDGMALLDGLCRASCPPGYTALTIDPSTPSIGRVCVWARCPLVFAAGSAQSSNTSLAFRRSRRRTGQRRMTTGQGDASKDLF